MVAQEPLPRDLKELAAWLCIRLCAEDTTSFVYSDQEIEAVMQILAEDKSAVSFLLHAATALSRDRKEEVLGILDGQRADQGTCPCAAHKPSRF